MSDKKYYYLRLKDFLDTEEFKILESQENGYLYSNILMKMYLISLKKSERLALNGMIPYDVDMIAALTEHCVEVVKEALKHLVKLGLIEMLSAGAVYMMDVQNYVCQSSNTEYKSKEEKADVEEYKPKKETARERIDYARIVDKYNEICKSYSRVTRLSKRRKDTIRARFNAGYTYEDFEKAFEMVEESDFLKGKNNRNWCANFDWICNDTNLAKILDGNYTNRKGDKYGRNGEDHRKSSFAEKAIELGAADTDFKGF